MSARAASLAPMWGPRPAAGAGVGRPADRPGDRPTHRFLHPYREPGRGHAGQQAEQQERDQHSPAADARPGAHRTLQPSGPCRTRTRAVRSRPRPWSAMTRTRTSRADSRSCCRGLTLASGTPLRAAYQAAATAAGRSPTRAGRSRPRRPPSSPGSFRRAVPARACWPSAAGGGRPHGRLRGRARHLAPVVQGHHQDRQDHREPDRPGRPPPDLTGGQRPAPARRGHGPARPSRQAPPGRAARPPGQPLPAPETNCPVRERMLGGHQAAPPRATAGLGRVGWRGERVLGRARGRGGRRRVRRRRTARAAARRGAVEPARSMPR